jgi:chemotaxis protein methyltransferase CheR
MRVSSRGGKVTEDVEDLTPLYRIVYLKTGLDLKPYKEKYLRRRVAVRLRATGQPDLAAYVVYLESVGDEMERLVHCLTIHVSDFFRNPTTFQAIRSTVFPDLFREGERKTLRFWSVGCARGEEPYSLAILVHEHLGGDLAGFDVRIDAIDVNAKILEEAKRGEFGAERLKEIGPDLAKKYFTGNGTGSPLPQIRRMVKFHRRDILMEPAEEHYDFVLCRNLLIYIEREPQELILERFHRVLRPGGYLVLGRTEALAGRGRHFFEIVDAKERIYRRIGEREPAFSERQRSGEGRTI